MILDSKLSSVLHVLLHMAHSDKPMTSQEMAARLNSNAVVVRRVMAGLRVAGYITSEKGHGGGWSMACRLDDVTLHDIYKAVGASKLFAIGNRSENPACLVEQAVNEALSSALKDAEALVLDRLAHITLADLSADFNRRFARFQPEIPHS